MCFCVNKTLMGKTFCLKKKKKIAILKKNNIPYKTKSETKWMKH